MTTTTAALDEAKLGAFEERLTAMFNAGAVCLMTSIGHRTGLFDAMAGCRRERARRSRPAPT
jgi:hypothetical protein